MHNGGISYEEDMLNLERSTSELEGSFTTVVFDPDSMFLNTDEAMAQWEPSPSTNAVKVFEIMMQILFKCRHIHDRVSLVVEPKFSRRVRRFQKNHRNDPCMDEAWHGALDLGEIKINRSSEDDIESDKQLFARFEERLWVNTCSKLLLRGNFVSQRGTCREAWLAVVNVIALMT
jgi:hypothetical protein